MDVKLKVNNLKYEIHEHDGYKLSTYITENTLA